MISRSLLLKVLRTYPKLTRTCPRHLSAQSDPYTMPDRCLYQRRPQVKKDLDQQKAEKVLDRVDELRSQGVIDDDGGAAPPVSEFYEDEEVPRRQLMSDELVYPEKEVEVWVTSLSGERLQVIDLPSEIYGLAPRVDMLYPVILRQLKFKIQSEPWGSEYDLFADRFAEKLYHNRPELKPWLAQGIAWKQYHYTKPSEILWESTSHDPIPYYSGNIPWKLRMSGLRALLSLKMRYDKLVIVDDLGRSDFYSKKQKKKKALRDLLDERGFTSTLMITGKSIVPAVQRDSWKRTPVFPNPEPGVQRTYETARNTYACELRETGGLDVWSALLYDTLILDLAAVEALNAEILLSLQPSAVPNMSLVRSLSEIETEGTLFKMPLRFKDVQVINMDNM